MKLPRYYYPIALNLEKKLTVVAGGGQVSSRKIKGLLKAGAKITVVSPQVTPFLERLARGNKVKWAKRGIKYSDVIKADIVIGATSDQALNKKISLWAKQRGILVNVVDCAKLSDFISPAIFRHSKAVVAVYTHGEDPVLSRDLKNFLKENWDVFLSYRNRLQKRAY